MTAAVAERVDLDRAEKVEKVLEKEVGERHGTSPHVLSVQELSDEPKDEPKAEPQAEPKAEPQAEPSEAVESDKEGFN